MTTSVKPTRNNVYVEKIHRTRSGGGIEIPLFGAFCGHSAKKKMAATPDYFPALVLAIGPDVRDVAPGDEVLVMTFAAGDGSKLFSGDGVGEKNRLMIKADGFDADGRKIDGDILGVVESEPEAEDASKMGDVAGDGTALAPSG